MKNFINFATKKSRALTDGESFWLFLLVCGIGFAAFQYFSGNLDDSIWTPKRKTFVAKITQAMPMIESIDAYNDAHGFISNALKSVIKVNNICAASNIEVCGINRESITRLADGTTSTFPASWKDLGISIDFSYADSEVENAEMGGSEPMVAAFDTDNGESAVIFYNPQCYPPQGETPVDIEGGNYGINMFDHVCLNMVYDVNADAAPNLVGKDIGFITVYFPVDPIVSAPIPHALPTSLNGTANVCPEGFRVPNRFEAATLMLNSPLIQANAEGPYLTSTRAATSSTTYTFWQAQNLNNTLSAYTQEGDINVGFTRCVRR